jgi:hypothetical protein
MDTIEDAASMDNTTGVMDVVESKHSGEVVNDNNGTKAIASAGARLISTSFTSIICINAAIL